MGKYRIVGTAAVLSGTLFFVGCGINTSPGNHSQRSHSTSSPQLNSAPSPTGPSSSPEDMNTSPSSPKATHATLAFQGSDVRRYVGTTIPPAVPTGYHGTDSATMIFSPTIYHTVEGFSGKLHGHTFVVDFYQDTAPSSAGLYVGVEYHQHPVYFGYGPAATFQILAFNGDNVVLGNMTQGTYMVLNLMTGQQNLQATMSEAQALPGYTQSTPPKQILGLSGTHYATNIP